MEFRDLKKQYKILQPKIEEAVKQVCEKADFISGQAVKELERELAEYVGVKHCITCANGTDALQLALMAWNIGPGDAVFVPDFTFFATGEAPALLGAVPIFVDVEEETFNMDSESLRGAIERIRKEGILRPKVVITVDLFGHPADYNRIRKITEEYDLLLLEDGAQGFGGAIKERKACSFGDISTTSFFPAKPLGCYGDGGAIFTDNNEWAMLIRSLAVHGKGTDKYDNVRIGINSRLDTIQAAILRAKLEAFCTYELEMTNNIALLYTSLLKGLVKVPSVKTDYYSSWAQYTIILKDEKQRDGLQSGLAQEGIPSAIYYGKPMQEQKAFIREQNVSSGNKTCQHLCNRVLSLPIGPYIGEEDVETVCKCIKKVLSEITYM